MRLLKAQDDSFAALDEERRQASELFIKENEFRGISNLGRAVIEKLKYKNRLKIWRGLTAPSSSNNKKRANEHQIVRITDIDIDKCKDHFVKEKRRRNHDLIQEDSTELTEAE